MQSVVAHNIHENIGHVQEGGTSLLLFGALTDQLAHDQLGKDKTGLGRCSVMTLKGERVQTKVVCGYNPCYKKNLNSSTLYQQHRRYFITKKGDLTCPRTEFKEDLIAQLTKWRKEGDRLIVCLDANEHIYKKSIGKALTDIDGLAMREVVGDFTRQPVGPTYFWRIKTSGNHASWLWNRRPPLICHRLLHGRHDRYLLSEGCTSHVTATEYKDPKGGCSLCKDK